MSIGVRTPFYRIIIDGKPMSDDLYLKVSKVSFKEPEDGEQYFEIYFADHDFSVQDSGTFVVDKTVCTLEMGYLDDYGEMMTGIVQAISPDFPQSDSPSFSVTVKNIAAVMNREQRNVRYVNKTYSDVVIEIAKKYGLLFDVDDTRYLFNPEPEKKSEVQPQPVEAALVVGGKAKLNGYLYASSYGEGRGQKRNQEVTISRIVDTSRKCPYLVNGTLGWVQRADLTPLNASGEKPPATTDDTEPVVTKAIYQTGKSDFDFCRSMAKQIGYRFYIDGAKLYFKKSIEKEVLTLEYRVGECNLLSFRPNVNTTNKGRQYKAANIDFNSATATPVASTGTPTEAQTPTPAPAVPEEKVATTPRTYTVKAGDYLIKIAKAMYGDGSRYKDIYNANTSKVKMPNYVIYTGTVLTIP